MLSKSLRLPTFRSFHCSLQRNLTIPFLSTLPQAPGGVKGDVNEAYVPPHSNKLHGSLHWNVEKVLAVSLAPLVTFSLASTGSLSTVVDTLLASALLGHCYVGFQSCIIDYIPARVYGKNHNYAMYLLGMGSVLSMIGIYKLETQENGAVGLLKNMWNKPEESSDKN